MIKQTRWLGSMIYTASIFSFILLAVGFTLAISEQYQPAKKTILNQRPSNQQAGVHGGMLVSLGDSLTRGIGDSTGQGYFGIVKSSLQKESKEPIVAVNLAISGSTSSQLVKQVQQSQVRDLVKKANWITMTIGGNDLFRGSGRLEKIDEKGAEQSRITYEQNLNFILSELRKNNTEASIFIFGLYNPFGDLAQEKKSSHLVAVWNETMQKVADHYDHVVVVPTFDLFQLQPETYLYTDHFHPNQQGYERMADRLLQVINDTKEEKKTAYAK